MGNILNKFVSCIESLLTWLVVFIFRHKFNRCIYRFNFPEVWYSPWNGDDDFAKIYTMISGNTLVTKRKLYDLFCISKQLNRLGGDYLEVGTLCGGTAGILANSFSGNKLVLWHNWGEHIERDDYFIEKIYSTSDDLKRTRQLLTRIAPQISDPVFYVDQAFPCKKVIEELDTNFSLVHFDIYD
jgi:hypothetical protein